MNSFKATNFDDSIETDSDFCRKGMIEEGFLNSAEVRSCAKRALPLYITEESFHQFSGVCEKLSPLSSSSLKL
jgi:hypothetical protein